MKNSPTVSPSGRILELDSLRGIAAFAVLLCHLPLGFWLGETAVDLFFVLSGYLITDIILRNRGRAGFIKVFYARRALRIWPIYYLAIMAIIVLNSLRRHPEEVTGLPYYLLYFQNVPEYWGGTTPPFPNFGHSWTLAIEEQFYLVWPLLVGLVCYTRTRLLIICPLLILFSIMLRFCGYDRVLLLAHLDGLALGALLACAFWHAGQSIHATKYFAALALIAFATYIAFWLRWNSIGFSGKDMVKQRIAITLISLSYFGLVGLVVANRNHRFLGFLRIGVLIYLGQISYGLYLYHWIIYEWLDTKFKIGMGFGDAFWLQILKLATAVGAAMISWHIIERPILSLKDRFAYRPDKSYSTDETSQAVLQSA